VRNEEGRRIRQAFIAPEDYVVSADYSQIELRIMAHLSRDKGLLTAFAEGRISTGRRRQKCLACRWKA
jgi:DNA polymerase-1